MRIMLKALSGCCVVAALITTPASAEPRCSERSFTASGTPGRVHFSGRRNARLAWAAKVRSELGQAYATWDRATSRNFDCVYAEWHYRCTATARPCRSFVAGR